MLFSDKFVLSSSPHDLILQKLRAKSKFLTSPRKTLPSSSVYFLPPPPFRSTFSLIKSETSPVSRHLAELRVAAAVPTHSPMLKPVRPGPRLAQGFSGPMMGCGRVMEVTEDWRCTGVSPMPSHSASARLPGSSLNFLHVCVTSASRSDKHSILSCCLETREQIDAQLASHI